MVPLVYEFEKIYFKKQKNYIFQRVQGRKLTDVYHSHDFYELLLCVNGSGVQLVNEEEMRLKKGEALLLRPSDRHCFVSQTEDVAVVSLSVKREEMELFSNVYDALLLGSIHRGDMPFCFSYSFPSAGIIEKEDGAVDEYDCKLILSWFLKGYIDASGCLERASELPFALAYAVEEMQKTENLRRGIAAFTELSHYSQSHLARLIRKYFKTSLKQYVNELRLQSAYNSIVLTRQSTEEISEALGFLSFSHFNKIFKARFSVTPAALRKSRGAWTA